MHSSTHGWGFVGLFGGLLTPLLLPLLSDKPILWWLVVVVSFAGFLTGIWLLLRTKLIEVLRKSISSDERRRQLLTWVTISAGALILAFGIYRLASSQPTLTSGQQVVISLSKLVHHTQTTVSFDHLESDNIIRVYLSLLNASTTEVTIDGVSGTISDNYPKFDWPALSWSNAGNHDTKIISMGSGGVAIEQRIPQDEARRIRTVFAEGRSISLYFERVKISIRSQLSPQSELISLWDGVVCSIPKEAVATSRIVMAAGRTSP